MKKFYTVLLLIFIISSSTSYAQKGNWYLGNGVHFVDYYATMKGEPMFKSTNWNGGIMPQWFSVGYAFSDAIHLNTSLSFMTIDLFPGSFDYDQFMDWDINFQYHLTDGYIIPVDFRIDPYVIVGGGINKFDYWRIFSYNVGLGVNLWVGKYWGLSWQTTFDGVPGGSDYLQHVASAKVRFASAKDTDGDGIVDNKDDCPLVFGPKNTNGCPDRDGDGIRDAADLCPDHPGLAEFQGCPDSDGDGIVDAQDDCPQVPGTMSAKGCPDRDGDGIADVKDLCPDVPGVVSAQGCPDRDGDGIADANDKCPDVPGVVSAQGCPDRDGDGIADKDDKCPDTPGIVKAQGCPDRDGDGIADKDDKCPDVFGVIANNGCPVIDDNQKKEIDDQLRFSAKNINFETASDVIKTESYKDLDNIVMIMNKFPASKFKIEGHTDNVGKDVMNQDLSDRRAQSVKKYFTDKGIEVARLDAKGYGETKPIADNSTKEGRAENRRVEISILK